MWAPLMGLSNPGVRVLEFLTYIKYSLSLLLKRLDVSCPGFTQVMNIKEKKQKHTFSKQVMEMLVPKAQYRESGWAPPTLDFQFPTYDFRPPTYDVQTYNVPPPTYTEPITDVAPDLRSQGAVFYSSSSSQHLYQLTPHTDSKW